MDSNIKLVDFDKQTGYAKFLEYSSMRDIRRKIELNLFDIKDSGKGYECDNFKISRNGKCRLNGTTYDCLEDMLDGLSLAEKHKIINKDVDALISSVEIMANAGAPGIQKFETVHAEFIYKIVDKNSNTATVIIPRDVKNTALAYITSVWIGDDNKYSEVIVIGGGQDLYALSRLFNTVHTDNIDMSKLFYANVEITNRMYEGAFIKNLDLSWTHECSITNIDRMFNGYKGLVIDLNKFKTGHIKSLFGVFANTHAELIGGFDTSTVTAMTEVFSSFYGNKELDLSWMDVSSVTEMNCVFERCGAETVDISSWDTSNVVRTSRLFKKCKSKIIGINEIDLRNVVVANEMFEGITWRRRITPRMKWAKITNSKGMFTLANIRQLDLVEFGSINKEDEKQNIRSASVREVLAMFMGMHGKIMIDAKNCDAELKNIIYEEQKLNGNIKVVLVNKE